jgi:N-acetylmuramoyl-L-alanine amidase
MRYEQRKKKKSRWVLPIILVMALIMNGNMLGEAHGVEDDAVAVIGGAYYTTLDEAILAVADGETIQLLSSIEIKPDTVVDNEVTILGETGIIDRPNISFYLDLGNQSITGAKDGALLQVKAGSVTIYNGQITNTDTEEGGLAVSTAVSTVDEPTAEIFFPIGYQKPETMGATLDIPAAYHLQFTNSANGTIRYATTDGVQVPLNEGNLYAGENTAFTFHFVPDVGYKVDPFTINGVSQPTATSYQISNLTQDVSINVNFSKITYVIAPLAYANNVFAKLGVTMTPASATVEYGGNQTFTFTVRNGFKLLDVQVNDVSIGPVTTIELKNVTTPQNVKIILEKTAVFIMLDAGHFESYNHSPVLSSYYEGNTMWVYHQYLEQALEQYTNIIVDTTRINNSRAIGEALLPSQRGAMGEGYDLVLSVHSNAASTASADHPVAIYTLDPRYSSVSKTLGLKLATRVAEIMQTYETPEVYSKAQADGRDWYGVNRGAADVGVPSIILEHSFHTNYRATVWLSQDANLRNLAMAEAKVIADFYGVSGQMVVTAATPPPTPVVTAPPAPKAPTGPAIYVVAGVKKATVSWSYVSGASGYQIYRAYGSSGKYYKVKTITRGKTLKWTNYGRLKGKIYTYKVRPYWIVKRVAKYGAFSAPYAVRIR